MSVEGTKSDQVTPVGGGGVDTSAANTELENDGSMVLLDNSSFCGGTSCRDAVLEFFATATVIPWTLQ